MSKVSIASTWLAVVASIVIVFSSLSFSAKTDPVGRVTTASVAVHGVVIPPFNR